MGTHVQRVAPCSTLHECTQLMHQVALWLLNPALPTLTPGMVHTKIRFQRVASFNNGHLQYLHNSLTLLLLWG